MTHPVRRAPLFPTGSRNILRHPTAIIPIGGVYDVLGKSYRNVTKFHICGHVGNKIAVPADEVCYTLPDSCYWICSTVCNGGFADASCAKIFAETQFATTEVERINFERMVYGKWSEYLTMLQDMKWPLPEYELINFRACLQRWEVMTMERRLELLVQMQRKNEVLMRIERRKQRLRQMGSETKEELMQIEMCMRERKKERLWQCA